MIRMDLEVRHLKLVEAIASEGGMTRAADRLHLTQSALSHQLKEIEDRLDTLLFLRLKKKMVLTEAGERVLKTARQVLEELTHTEEEVRKIGRGEQGVLRISTQCNTCYHWLPSMLKLFYQKHPGVEVRIVLEATDAPVKALMEGRLDVAVAYSRISDSSLVYYPLFKDELVVVVPRDHTLASSKYVKAEDLAERKLNCVCGAFGDEPCVSKNPGSEWGDTKEDLLRHADGGNYRDGKSRNRR